MTLAEAVEKLFQRLLYQSKRQTLSGEFESLFDSDFPVVAVV